MEPVTVVASLLNAALSLLRIVKDNKMGQETAAQKEKKKKKASAVIQPTLNEIKRYGQQLPRSSEVREELKKIEQLISAEIIGPPRVRKRRKKATPGRTAAKGKGTKKHSKRL